MKKPILKRKGIKIAFWTTGVILFLLLAVQIFTSIYLPGIIKKRVVFLVENGSDGLYKCSVGGVSVNVLGGTVSIKDVEVKIDSVKYNHIVELGSLPDATFEANLEEGKITGFKLFPFLFSKKIVLNTIKIVKAEIRIYSEYDVEKERLQKIKSEQKKQYNEENNIKEPIREQKLWQLIEPEIKGIRINWIFLDDTKFSYRKASSQSELKVSYNNLSATLKGIRVDSVGASEKNRILFTEDISLNFTGLKFFTPDSLYMINVDSMVYSSFTKDIIIKGFGVNPTLDAAGFSAKIGQQVDAFDVKVPSMLIKNFQVEKIFSDNAFQVDSIEVDKPLVKIFHDRTFPADTVVKYGQYPNEAILKTPIALRIPLIILKESEVHYIEKQAVTYKTGDAFFSKVSGTMTNVTNDTGWLKTNSHMVIDMQGNFLHSGKMTASFDFDLASPMNEYTAKADMGRIGAKELNIMTIPFGNMEMKTADLKEAHFRLQGNKNGTIGSLRMIYNNLTVEMLAVDKKNGGMKDDKFMSFLANLVGVRKDNPDKKGIETKAENIVVKRTPVMPFFNMIWKTLFGGMKEIMLKGPAKNIKIGQE